MSRPATTTLVFVEGPFSGGGLLAMKLAERLGARYGAFRSTGPDAAELVNGIVGWLSREDCSRLNVSGPSKERCPGIYRRVMALLDQVGRIVFAG
jgi:hypothetical protein